MPTVDSAGVRIVYKVHGNGPPIVLAVPDVRYKRAVTEFLATASPTGGRVGTPG
jgi:hypothetical protein